MRRAKMMQTNNPNSNLCKYSGLTPLLAWEDASIELFVYPPTNDTKGVRQTIFAPDFSP
jgi:hypothetical protein